LVTEMSDLIAIAYDDRFKAEEVRLTLAKLQTEHLIELEDAAVVIKTEDGKVKLNQAVNLAGAGTVGGGFWGLLIGTLLFSPLFGAMLILSANMGIVRFRYGVRLMWRE
ncbi:MAG: DUF1269 domain-containing protein, partial [Prochloraceae cyanobacterium]